LRLKYKKLLNKKFGELNLGNKQRHVTKNNTQSLFKIYRKFYSPGTTTQSELEELDLYEYIEWHRFQKCFTLAGVLEHIRLALALYRKHRKKFYSELQTSILDLNINKIFKH
jgi:hypothetical protein